jgi:DNA-binding MarR family transcriptional regulator
VGSPEELAAIERQVLTVLGPEDSSTGTIAGRLRQPAGTIDAAVSRLVRAGLVATADGRVTLTRRGRLVAAHVRTSSPPTTAAGLVTCNDGCAATR